MGPVEYAILRFPGAMLDERIEPALREIVEGGVVRMLDVVFLRRRHEEELELFELTELPPDAAWLRQLAGETVDLLRAEDVDGIAEELGPDSCALVIVWEDAWAARFMAAVRAAGCDYIETARIPAAVVGAALVGAPEGFERSATW